MATIQQDILIGATVKQAYAYLADIERVQVWLPHVIAAERTSAAKHGEGAELNLTVEAAGKRAQGVTRCTVAESPHRLAFTSTLDVGLTSTTTIVLAAEGKQTRLSAAVEYRFTGGGFGRLLGGLFGDSYVRKDLGTALANVKSQIESEQAQRLQKRRASAAL